ncbi:DUF2868 domain-containing protein [Pelistega ratti]|uniref:DUF2868 domain-containing protein n=1 Tax=Pelistega ratti TaxID=2652177 RepID=UPI00135C4589|nr:DUF2868 domain-containing protein [Pelistega ratti]
MQFNDFWITETIRQKEENWGPLDDSTIMRQLQRDTSPSIENKIIRRATLIAQREGILTIIQQWTKSASLALYLLAFFGVITGISLALSATQQNHINLALALAALLGLHAITYLLWLLSFFKTPQTTLGKCWLWLSQKMARSPHTSLVAHSFISALKQAKAIRWILGTLSHAFWLIILTTASLTLLILWTGKSYTFAWETTILSQQTFTTLTHLLGKVPSFFGFPIPDTMVISSADNTVDIQKSWSYWLLGQVLIWGVFVRFISLLFCLLRTRKSIQHLSIDLSSPAYATLAQRFQLQTERIGTDSPATPYTLPTIEPSSTITQWTTQRIVIGIELPTPDILHSLTFHHSVSIAGNIESREDRHQLLDQLIQQPIQDLLLVCDATQTPDRGIAYFIRDIAKYSQQIAVYLYTTSSSSDRLSLWEKTLSDIGIDRSRLFTHPQQLSSWIAL